MLKKLNTFFKSPVINKAGFCKEAGISQQYLNSVLAGRYPLTDKFVKKIMPTLNKYGYL
jgi:hypothetical protein